MNISIVIPVFNEMNNIESTVQELEDYMNNYTVSGAWEMIIVNDGSDDGTTEALNRIDKSKKNLKLVDLYSHYGRGKALRTGIKEATGDIIISLDADLSYAPYHIKRLIECINKENADIVIASAYRKNGSVKNVPLARLWISKFGNRILSYMFGGDLTVLTCLTRAYKKDFINRIDLHSDDKSIHLEILYKSRLLGAKILEVPADL